MQWSITKTKGDFKVKPRDEHTAVSHNEKMYIFGGFEFGVRLNTILCFNFETSEW